MQSSVTLGIAVFVIVDYILATPTIKIVFREPPPQHTVQQVQHVQQVQQVQQVQHVQHVQQVQQVQHVQQDQPHVTLYTTTNQQQFATFGAQCNQVHRLNYEDAYMLKSLQIPERGPSACFMGCVMEKTGLMDSCGNIRTHAFYELERAITNDKRALDDSQDIMRFCVNVADNVQYDGRTNCGRVRHFMNCLMQEMKNHRGQYSSYSNGGTTVLVWQSDEMRRIYEEMFQYMLKVTCLTTAREFLPGRIITQYLPSMDVVNFLCNFMSH